MLFSYAECMKTYGSAYQIKKAVHSGKIFQIEKGIYSDEKYVSELQIIAMKYSKAIFTMNSAFYYHGLTDVIPDYYCIQTVRGASKIRDIRIKQVFENSVDIDTGKTKLIYDGTEINIYNKERMFIELVRSKNRLPFDYYKEIIDSYRRIINKLDIQAIEEYACVLPKTNMVMDTLQMEVL